jgi:DNA-binding SARP family transcriptional activator
MARGAIAPESHLIASGHERRRVANRGSLRSCFVAPAAQLMASDAGVEVLLLGPVEARVGTAAVAVTSAKQRLILAVLALRLGRAVSADVLIDLIWGERPPPTAAKALQVHMGQLRNKLQHNRLLPAVIVHQPAGYRLDIERSATDLGRFEDRWAEGRSALAAGDAETAARTLADALALWRGEPLADLAYEHAVVADTMRLEELRLGCLEDRIDADLALRRHPGLVPELASLVRDHPLRERLQHQYITALYRCGRQAEALAAHRALRVALRDRLGLEPSRPLVELERAILRHDPALEAPSAAAAGGDRPPSTPPHPARVVMVASQTDADLERVVAVAQPLAADASSLVLARVIHQLDGADGEALAHANDVLTRYRDRLQRDGIGARVAAFTSRTPGADLVKLASHEHAELLILDETAALRNGHSGLFDDIGGDALCDVGMLVAGAPYEHGSGILVPFGGGEHDWAALEVAAAIAMTAEVPLILAGAGDGPTGGPNASRLLADASLILQRVVGIVPEPALLERGVDELLERAASAGLVVAGISAAYRREGLGETRYQLAIRSPVPVMFVRRGRRPGVLAPNDTLTRFSWSLPGVRA